MSLTAKTPAKKPRELPKNEMSQAACAFVVDCGEHEETNQEGVVSIRPKVMFLFELEQKRSDGLPHIMAQTFTNSLHKKANLRSFLERWDGKSFSDAEATAGVDLGTYQGKNAYITPVLRVVKDMTYANIGSISKIRERDVPMAVTVRELPKWVSEYIAKAKVKPDGFVAPKPEAGQSEDNLPF